LVDLIPQAERNQLVNDLTTSAKTRAQVLRAVAENQDLNNAEFNRAFVLMQYFGYLRRNPNDPQDADFTGYEFWLTKLNQFNGDYIAAEMVKAFISSDEYRQRFGPAAATSVKNDAAFVAQSAPSSVVVGEDFTAVVRMRNLSNTTWTADAAYRLGTQAPQDNDVWGLNRGVLSASIAPNSDTEFSLPLFAPTTPGAYSFKWRMVQDGVEWFGEVTPALTVNVSTLPTSAPNMAAFVSQSVPTAMSVGKTYTVSVTMKNTGTTTWKAGDAYRLGSRAPQDNDYWGRNRVLLPSDILPGAEVIFSFDLTAPQTAGTYNFRWRMVRDGVEWFGEFTPNQPVTVR
jgi:hypothetical protein